jgi:hypothetical protein
MTLPAFYYWLREERTTNTTPEELVTTGLITFCDQYWMNATGSRPIHDAVKALDGVINRTGLWTTRIGGPESGQQQDSSEFLGHLLDAVKDATGTENVGTGTVPATVPVNMMDALFTVSEQLNWICRRCNTERPLGNPQPTHSLTGLSLTVRNEESKSRGRLLDKFLNEAFSYRLPGPQCSKDKCQRSPRSIFARNEIVAAPEILIFTLTSWQFDKIQMIQRKLPTSVDVPEWLNMAPFLSNNITRGRRTYWYKLVAIVKHNGASVQDGHYTGAFRAPPAGRPHKNEKPFDAIDDETVVPMTLDGYKLTFPKSGMHLPYIVTYERRLNKK